MPAPSIATSRVNPSTTLPGRAAAMTPSGMPMTMLRAIATATSSIDGGSAVARSCAIGRWVNTEMPKFPCTRWLR